MKKEIVMLVMLDGAVIGEKIVTYTSTQEEWEDESGLMDEASYFFY
jgi:hypothetical protein